MRTARSAPPPAPVDARTAARAVAARTAAAGAPDEASTAAEVAPRPHGAGGDETRRAAARTAVGGERRPVSEDTVPDSPAARRLWAIRAGAAVDEELELFLQVAAKPRGLLLVPSTWGALHPERPMPAKLEARLRETRDKLESKHDDFYVTNADGKREIKQMTMADFELEARLADLASSALGD